MSDIIDPDEEYRILPSESPYKVDGYGLGEPKYLECEECGGRVLLTSEPSPTVAVVHDQDCPQRRDTVLPSGELRTRA